MQTHAPSRPWFFSGLRAFSIAILAAASLHPQAAQGQAWDPNPETEIAGYNIYLGTSQENLALFKTVPKTELAHVFKGLAPSTTYFCSVRAISSSGTLGGMSPQVSYTTPAAATLAGEIVVETSAGASMTSHADSVSFAAVEMGAASLTETITIRNLGIQILSGLDLTVQGAQFLDFLVSSPGVTSLAPGESTTFDVTFVPNGTGSRTATLAIASNDADENPFVLNLNGTGKAPVIADAPEITVLRADGSNLSNGSAALTFGALNPGTSSAPQVITIRNSGSTSLNGLSLIRDGSHAADFTVSSLTASTLAPGASTTFTVIFKPGAAGNRSAAIHISSNDADENPFDISLAGNGIALPDIAVLNAAGSNLVDGTAAISFASVNLGSTSASQSITIKNLGVAILSGLSVSVSGSHASDFTISSFASPSLLIGSSTTLNVTFKPGAAGTRSAALRISSNDPDENPFDISLSGTGIAVAEIAVEKSDGTNLTDNGAAISFGTANLGTSAAAQTFTIRNPGTAALTGLALSLTGSHSADFTVSSLTNTLATGAATTFSVVFKPGAAGTRSAILSIASNDADESPFEINLAGTGGTVAEIAVAKSDGTNLVDGSASVSFSSSNLGAPGTIHTFTLSNPGSATLTGISLSVSGSHSADFTYSSIASSLTAGTSTTFVVTFKPAAAGLRNTLLRIASSDADENPFDINLSGTGIAAAEIAVEKGDGTNLTDNGAAVSMGNVILGNAAPPTVFTIRNHGTAALTGLAISLAGIHAPDFTASSIAPILAPGSSATFTVTFKPSTAGSRGAILRIASNDADENPFDINLLGNSAAVPEIAVEDAAGTNLHSGSAMATFGQLDLQSAALTRTITIRNTGSAFLTGISSAIVVGHTSDFVTTAPGALLLAPGASTTLSVRFLPTAAGPRSAVLRITSNDADENPYSIALTGIGISTPDIDVTLSDETPLPSGGENFGNIEIGQPSAARTFTIHNRGTADLSGLSVSTSGSHHSDFMITGPLATSLAPGASADIGVVFTPAAAGKHTATLRILSNDIDESTKEIELSGIGLAIPRIAISASGSGTLIENPAAIDFGTTADGTEGSVRTISIRNTGSGNLSGLKIIRGGKHIDDFEVASLRDRSLTPGESTSFKVAFIPGNAGKRLASLTITSNDSAQGDFVISLTGHATPVPDIEIRIAGGPMMSDENSFINFGSGGSRVFTITNRGSANLTGLSIKGAGIHQADFTASRIKAKSLAPGKSTTFKVKFQSGGSGTRWAAVKIASNDPDTKSFDISLTGGRSSSKSAPSTRPSPLPDANARQGEQQHPVTSVMIVSGLKYRCITIPKSRNLDPDLRQVEVSGNLLDWFSGDRHLTVVKDNAAVLKVRDNIPLDPGTKRFIRLKKIR